AWGRVRPPMPCGLGQEKPLLHSRGASLFLRSTDLAAGAVTPDPPLFDGGRTCVRRLLLGFCHGYEDCGRLLLNWLGRRHRAGSRLGGSLAFSPLLSAYRCGEFEATPIGRGGRRPARGNGKARCLPVTQKPSHTFLQPTSAP